jgi:hypothetical protein
VRGVYNAALATGTVDWMRSTSTMPAR